MYKTRRIFNFLLKSKNKNIISTDVSKALSSKKDIGKELLNEDEEKPIKYTPKNTSTTSPSTQNPEDQPVRYTASNAFRYKAETTRAGVDFRPWYEPYVILASMTVFMIYFCILREENDIDDELGRSLYSRIAGLEEYQLNLSLQYNRERGLDTKDIEARLQEIRSQRGG